MEELMVSERAIIIELIQLFKNSPCLWDTSHELYCNRDARNQAFTKLKECYSKLERDATVDDVKKKLENMRTAYRRERRKVQNRKATSVGIDDNYTPSLWYYPYFKFLNEKNKSETIETDIMNGDEGSDNDREAPEKKKTKHSHTHKESELIQKQINLVDAAKRLMSSREKNLADIFGQYVGSQLKELPTAQCWLAEKFISDILYYAKTGELNKESTLSLNTQQPMQCDQQTHLQTQWSSSPPLHLDIKYSPQSQSSPSPQRQSSPNTVKVRTKIEVLTDSE